MSMAHSNFMNVGLPSQALKYLAQHLHTPIKTRESCEIRQKLQHIFVIVMHNNNEKLASLAEVLLIKIRLE